MLTDKWPEDHAKRWPSFSISEMACRCGCGSLPDPEFMTWLQNIRNAIDKPMPITSGARCKAHNQAIGGAAESVHTTGMAADVHVDGPTALVLIGAAYLWGVKGWGAKLHGPREKWHVHLDLGSRETRTAWTYE